MEYTCRKCGAEVTEDAMQCPKCKVTDPRGELTDEAERFNEEQVLNAGDSSKKKQ